jgi:hypothetical protein
MEVCLVRLNDYGTSSIDIPILCVASSTEAGKEEVIKEAYEHGYSAFDTREEAEKAVKEDSNIDWVFVWDGGMYFGYDVENGVIVNYSDSEISFEFYSVK